MAYPTLSTGQYAFDQPNQQFVFSAADGGASVTATLQWTPNQIITTELVVVPGSPFTYIPSHGGEQQITKPDGNTSNSAIFSADAGVAYYPSGTPLTKVASNPATGQYAVTTNDISVNGIGGYGQYTFAAGDAGQQVVISYQYLDPSYDTWAGQLGQALQVRSGLQGQLPSAAMNSAHPDQAVGYTLTALIEGDNAYLGTAGVMPNYSYEVQGIGVVGAGTVDADPIVCAQKVLTDPLIGIGFPSASIDQSSWFNAASSAESWVKANGLYISQALENQTGAGGLIGRWLEAFNIAAVWSEGLLKLVPYGDESIGAYTPDTTVVVSLTDDNFLHAGNDDPVKLTRTPWADAHNRVQVNYKSRINSYNDDLVYEQDEASVERFGLRIAAPESLEFVSTWNIASAVATMKLKRLQSVRNSYEFALPLTFEFLEPGDLVALTDGRLGLSGKVVRVTKIENDTKAGLNVTCEDWPGNGYAMPVANPKQVTPSQHPTQSSASAGGTNAIIVQADNAAPGQTGTRLYIWCLPADTPSWSGCAAYMSTDGSNYSQIGVVTQPGQVFSLQGTLAAVASSPSGSLGLTHDTTSSVTVAPATTGNQVSTTAGLSAYDPAASYAAGAQVLYDGQPWAARAESSGELPTDASAYWQRIRSVTSTIAAPQSVTETAASTLDNLAAVISANASGQPTACEFLTFATVAAGAQPSTYTVSDFYRGALGSTIQSFAAGSKLVLFGGASVFKDIPAALAGQTLYFKFVAWNGGGVSRQQLASVPAVQFVVAPSGSAGVLEGLGPPIGDVVRNNAGSGELVVAPRGGVSGNLPYTNHSPTITGVVNGSGQIVNGTFLDSDLSNSVGEGHLRSIGALTHSGNFQSGRLLGGDSGLPADGGAGALGIGLTQTADPLTLVNVNIFDASPYLRWNDTAGGGRGFYRQSTGGSLQDWDMVAAALRIAVDSTGLLGVGAAPDGSATVESFGHIAAHTASPVLAMKDTTGGGRQYSFQSVGTYLHANDDTAGAFRSAYDASGNFGLGGAAGVGFDNFLASQRLQGASPYMYWQDNAAGGHTYYRQSAGGSLQEWDNTAAALRALLNSAGALGVDGTPSGRVTLESFGHLGATATGPALEAFDTTAGGHEYYWQSLSTQMLVYDATAVATRAEYNAAGLYGVGGAPTQEITAFGNSLVQGTSPTVYAQDTAGGGVTIAMYSTGGQGRMFLAGPGDVIHWDASQQVSIGGSTVSGFPLSILGVGVFDINSYMKASLGPHSTQLNQQGSINPVAGTCVITFGVNGTPAVTVTVTAGTLYLPDGSTISVPAFSQSYTTWNGHTVAYPPTPGSGTVNNFYQGNVVWDVASAAIQVQQRTVTLDTTAVDPTPLSGQDVAVAAADGLLVMAISKYATTSAMAGGGTGGGGGSGGGGDICPCADQLIETRERQFVQAGTLVVGDHLRGPNGWVKVTARKNAVGTAVTVHLDHGEVREDLRVSAAHPFMLHGTEEWCAASALRVGEKLAGGGVVAAVVLGKVERLAKLSCEGHIYKLGSTWSHNTCLN